VDRAPSLEEEEERGNDFIRVCHTREVLRANSTFAPDSCPILLKFKKIKFVQLSTGKYFLPKIAQIF